MRYTECMPPRLLSGKDLSEKILASLKPKVKKLDPRLVIVQVGDEPASTTYIRKKKEACESIGMRCDLMKLKASTSFKVLIKTIRALNDDADVTGYIIQLPLPGALHENEPQLFREIDPYKDVDGFTAYNLGKMFISSEFEHLPPATPAGIIELLSDAGIKIEGKCAVVVGQSNIVGKPIATMLLNRNATVIQCHKFTENLAQYTKQADILIVAVGKPNLITSEMVKKGVVVIDVGINTVKGKIVGDVDYDEVSKFAGAITPVPGGVGPLTVACLLRNCVRAKERQIDRKS